MSDLLSFLKKYWGLILLFLIYLAITYFFKIPNCLIKMFIGFPCPACGMTRAGVALLQFNFVEAFNYNPIIYLIPLITIVCIFKNTSIFKKLYDSKIFWIILIIIVLITYIIRLVYIYPNPPMNYEHNNLINLIKKILNL